jgi:hypothetical protein
MATMQQTFSAEEINWVILSFLCLFFVHMQNSRRNEWTRKKKNLFRSCHENFFFVSLFSFLRFVEAKKKLSKTGNKCMEKEKSTSAWGNAKFISAFSRVSCQTQTQKLNFSFQFFFSFFFFFLLILTKYFDCFSARFPLVSRKKKSFSSFFTITRKRVNLKTNVASGTWWNQQSEIRRMEIFLSNICYVFEAKEKFNEQFSHSLILSALWKAFFAVYKV